MLYVARKSVLT